MTPADDAEPSDDDLPEDDISAEEESEEGKPKKKIDKKKLIVFAVAGLLGLIIVGGGLAYFLGWLNPLLPYLELPPAGPGHVRTVARKS